MILRITKDILLQALTRWEHDSRAQFEDAAARFADQPPVEQMAQENTDYLWPQLEALALPGDGG